MIKLKYGLVIILLFIFMAVGVVACSPPVSENIVTAPETPAIAQSTEEVAVDIDTSLDPEVEEALPQSASSNHCLECHADQQMLIDTAAPIEVVESENEGEG
ncbi:MAG: hypothetical protein IMY76_08075 [Chloroflexi bacterium]|nr:hypothetical protein [Chloroflexota bacterium]